MSQAVSTFTTSLASNSTITMSSQEISELLGPSTRHDNVKRTVERLANRGTISHPPMEDGLFTDAQGKPRTLKVYHLDKRSSLIVVAQLSPEFTAKIIDRWQELEEAAARNNAPVIQHALITPAISHNAQLAYRALTANRVTSLPVLTRRIRGSMNAATVWEAVGELEAVGLVRVIPRQAHNKAPIYIEIIAPLPALAPQSQSGEECPVLRIKDAIDLMRRHMPSVVVGHPNITSHATAHMELAAARETATSTAGLIYQLNLAAVMAGELSEYKNNDPFLRDQSRTIQQICERAACAIA